MSQLVFEIKITLFILLPKSGNGFDSMALSRLSHFSRRIKDGASFDKLSPFHCGSHTRIHWVLTHCSYTIYHHWQHCILGIGTSAIFMPSCSIPWVMFGMIGLVSIGRVISIVVVTLVSTGFWLIIPILVVIIDGIEYWGIDISVICGIPINMGLKKGSGYHNGN